MSFLWVIVILAVVALVYTWVKIKKGPKPDDQFEKNRDRHPSEARNEDKSHHHMPPPV